MASLIEIPASGITARYYGLGRYLELKAKGEVPFFVFKPFFQREVFFGGLRFSIRAFSGGIPPVGVKGKSTPFDISYKLYIDLPQEHFNSRSVAIETLLGTWTIPIEYIEWPGPSDGDKDEPVSSHKDKLGKIIGDVLPPINENLLAGAQLVIRAAVPNTATGDKTWVKSWVRASFNETYFKLVNSSYDDGYITWTFEWAKLPTEPGESPQIIDITTTRWNGLVGPAALTSRIVQGYIVNLVFLKPQ